MKQFSFAVIFILTMGFVPVKTRSQVGGGFDLTWNAVDSGAVLHSEGGDFELSGTLGQPETGPLAGGEFDLSGGFWFELAPADCNEDGAADLLDHEAFTQCLTGPGKNAPVGCTCFDMDGSGAVDLRDFALAQEEFSGP